MAAETTIDPASPRFDAERVGGDAPDLQRGVPAYVEGAPDLWGSSAASHLRCAPACGIG